MSGDLTFLEAVSLLQTLPGTPRMIIFPLLSCLGFIGFMGFTEFRAQNYGARGSRLGESGGLSKGDNWGYYRGYRAY